MNLLLGTMTFGEQLFDDDVREIIYEFLDSGYNELDTAYVYNDGNSERLIGKTLHSINRNLIKIDSKANPRVTGRLDSYAVRMQLEESLIRMGTDYIDTYYLHFPDPNSQIEPVLETIDALYKEGKIREFGLSNFPLELIQLIYHLTEENGFIKPVVYEGLYNPLSRKIEKGLKDFLNEKNIRLNIYNPLAGGLLTDKYVHYSDKPNEGRFTLRPNYQERYWKPSYFEAIDELKKKCKKYGITIVEATMRWLANSSILNEDRGDGIIIGVSKKQHLKDNLAFAQKSTLPAELIENFETAWNICKEEAPEYYRFYRGKNG